MSAPIVSLFEGPPQEGYTTLLAYSGTDLEYIGMARSRQPESVWGKGTGFLVSIAVLTNAATLTFSAAHGLQAGNKIVISGATVDADLNGTYGVADPAPGGDGTKLTVATANVADGTYTEATLKAVSTAPRTTLPIWSIKRQYFAAGSVTRVAWANGSSAPVHVWGSRASYQYE